jgi:putative ABC transport system permease protein
MANVSRFLRSLWEGLKISLRAIGKNKTRSSLTTVCIVIGIVSVTSMTTLIDGINRSFESSLQMLGQNVVYVEKWPWGFGGDYKWWDYINRPDMKVKYANEIEEGSRFVEAASASSFRNRSVRYKDKSVEGVTIEGSTESITRTNPAEIDEGRFYTAEEARRGAKVAVLGSSVADALFDREYPLGKQVRISGQRFFVIGLLEKQGKFLGIEDTDNRIVVPISAFQQTFGSRGSVRLAVKFFNEQTFSEGQYEIEGTMRGIRQLDPLEENDFAVNKPEAFQQQYDAMTYAIYGIGIFLTSLALFIGGIGVMNIMFVSVRERTKEMGIRKAVGAKSWEILMQFLIEAVIICLAGGAIGVLLSMITTQIINQIFVAYLSWQTVALAIFICTVVGVIFGFLPAYRAAKSEPIESLRYE